MSSIPAWRTNPALVPSLWNFALYKTRPIKQLLLTASNPRQPVYLLAESCVNEMNSWDSNLHLPIETIVHSASRHGGETNAGGYGCQQVRLPFAFPVPFLLLSLFNCGRRIRANGRHQWRRKINRWWCRRIFLFCTATVAFLLCLNGLFLRGVVIGDNAHCRPLLTKWSDIHR